MRKQFLLLFLAHCSTFAQAQYRVELKGKIVDARFHRPLQEALVRIIETTNYTLTDASGLFTLSAPIEGNCTLEISYPSSITQQFTLSVYPNQLLDLGTLTLEKEDTTLVGPSEFIHLTEGELEDDTGVQGTALVLQATKDPFQQAVAYAWSSSFYRMRGLDNAYGTILLNGLVMNKIQNGRPQWSNWGGLNDVMRNQVYFIGSTPNAFTFGGIAGTQAITTRPSLLRKGKRLGISASNTSYQWRPFGSYASGLNKNNWAYAISGSYRAAKQAYWAGTNYDALSFFIGVEKKFNDQHSLSISAIYAKNKRTKNSANTQEQTALKGIQYNAYWGWQQGEKRNARYKTVEEPLVMLTHYWNKNESNTLTTTVGYQWGHTADSRLDYQDNLNPDPTYYRNLPSYYLNQIDPIYWSLAPEAFDALPQDAFKESTQASLHQASLAKTAFQSNGQLDWTSIYKTNQSFSGQSKTILYEDRQENHTLSASTTLHSVLTDHLTLDAGIHYRQWQATNFKKAIDLLGGSFYKDIDTFQEEEFRDSDLRNPNREIRVGDAYGYNYRNQAIEAEAFTLFTFHYNHWHFYLAESLKYTTYQREGQYQNPIFATTSFGKSELAIFNSMGMKGGFTYYLSGKHILSGHLAFYNQAPNLQNTFANIRVNNNLIQNLKQENLFHFDVNYNLRNPKFQMKITSYLTQIKNSTQLNFYYTEGLGLDDSKGNLISEVLTNLDKRHIGIELGIAYQISPTLKISSAAGLNQSFYMSNPNLHVYANHLLRPLDYGQAQLAHYRLANGPQTALYLGLEYRDPSFWFVNLNLSYLADAFVQVAPLKRTQHFVMDPDKMGQPYENLTAKELKQVLQQEKLPAFTLVALQGGKSWRLLNRSILGFFASIQNVFNTVYRTGGFEQARNATYAQEIAHSKGGHPLFGNKYWYGYGQNFFIQLYYNF